MSEQLAVIRNVHIGGGDRGIPCLWFDTYVSESSAALQVISWDQASEIFEILKSTYDIKDLEGSLCWVEVDGNRIQFLRLWSKS